MLSYNESLRILKETDALLEGQAQQDYYKASADKIRAEIEGLPLENKMEALEQVNDLLTKALECEIELTEEQLSYYNLASQTLTSQILALQGIDVNSLTGLDVDKALGPKIN